MESSGASKTLENRQQKQWKVQNIGGLANCRIGGLQQLDGFGGLVLIALREHAKLPNLGIMVVGNLSGGQ